jgi:hypothetical protein
MKITVVAGKGGKIIGTAHQGIKGKPEAGEGGPIAGPSQTVHVIDLPSELEKLEDAAELHRRLKSHIPSR